MVKYEIGDTAILELKFGAIAVKKKSIVTGKMNIMTMTGTTAHDLATWLRKREHGEPRKLVQDEFPLLTKEEREFIISGITPEEWRATFPPEKEDE